MFTSPRVLVFFCGAFVLQSTGAQTLEEAVRMMTAYEPELLAAHADSHSAAADIGVARGALLPQVRVDASIGGINRDRSFDGRAQGTGETLFTRQIGVSLRQLLFDGGSVGYQVRSAQHALAVQNYMEKGMIEARVVDLAEVYLEVLRTDVRLEEAKRNIEVHERIREQVHQRSGVGGTRTDTNLVDSRLVSARDALVNVQLARQSALDRFQRLVGQTPRSMAFPRLPEIPASRGDIDLSRNWNFLSAEAALLATEDKKKAVDRSNLPKVFLDVGLSQGQDLGGVEGTDDEARALVTMQWDLLTGGTRGATAKREGWQVIRAHELLRAADLDRNYRLTLLWREREGDLSALSSLRTQVDFLGQVAEDYESQFAVGKRDLLDILDIWSRHYEIKTRLIDTDFNLKTGAYRVLGIQGRLVEFFLGSGGWDDLGPGIGKEEITENAPAGIDTSIPHPHHPDAPDSDSAHSMELAPHEDWDFEPSEKRRGIFGRLAPHDHEPVSPPEPRKSGFQRGGAPVSTARPVPSGPDR